MYLDKTKVINGDKIKSIPDDEQINFTNHFKSDKVLVFEKLKDNYKLIKNHKNLRKIMSYDDAQDNFDTLKERIAVDKLRTIDPKVKSGNLLKLKIKIKIQTREFLCVMKKNTGIIHCFN